MRVCVALSGGADSVALLRALAEQSRELGLVLHAAHLHHGLRGEEADADLTFAQSLVHQLEIPFHFDRVDTSAEAEPNPRTGKRAETLEEAARRLRYGWFRTLLSTIPFDAIATAHTFDDQAETVLAKFLRGAWTEGLSGIHPVLEYPEGRVFRPLLSTKRDEIEVYLQSLAQPWREDSSNRHLTFTRNRIRHQLLPLLESWNPRLREHLIQMAELARDEESWWQAELSGLAPQLVLPGRAVRGGGRAGDHGIAIDVIRLSQLPTAFQRRIIRYAARKLGAKIDFAATESLRDLALSGRAGQKRELEAGFGAERTHRELRLATEQAPAAVHYSTKVLRQYTLSVPGRVDAPAFGLQLEITVSTPVDPRPRTAPSHPTTAVLRTWRAGDRVRVHHSASARKVKEVLDRMKVTGSDRVLWPVLEFDGRIVWMRGIELEPEPGLEIRATPLSAASGSIR